MKKVLIANRGEIACRIIAACRSLGLKTVAVCSEADAAALHVEMADERVEIGPAPARKSYLDKAAVLEAARRTGADAVHPGYGFLSESADFARMVEAAGLIWLGPDAGTIAVMGDKGAARKAAIEAGVPVLPGTAPLGKAVGADLDALGDEIGFPLLVKATAGGGGIGMRRVETPEALADAVANVQAHAERTFGDGTVYLERFIRRARHIEIQVFGDGAGHVAVFPERDCTLQRRYQKILEESPAPDLSEDVRAAMKAAARRLAQARRYRSAGTVEFVYDAETEDWFFLEMNTRIQVEHRVTEMVTGTDLVGMQLRLALGRLDDLAEEYGVLGGHWAIEARLCAEDPEKNFLPRPGRLERLELPASDDTLVVDCGLRQGDAVSPHYDSMIGKLVACGPSREAAMERLDAALAEVRIEGVATNAGFVRRLLALEDFAGAAVHTQYVDANLARLLAGESAAA
ncbi:acetyl-CoA carboxylase biotin carboxylase subunit [Roseovarius sp. HI0049]|nr:acetyl-CoA carboxylase biotin carboxylase subunit [Roseovarius sp. HI0049]